MEAAVARIPRCLVASLDQPELDAATRHHLAKVLRMAPGAPLELIDGRGGLLVARWTGDSRPAFDDAASFAEAPSEPLWLAVAPPRPSRLDWLVEKAAELGVDRLLLAHTRHAARSISEGKVLRLQRKANEALLQCRRLHALSVVAERPLIPILDEAAEAGADLWVADAPADEATRPPHAQDASRAPSGGQRDRAPTEGTLPPRTAGRPLLAVIGPEGGLSQEERSWLAERGAHAVNLGRGVLRVETAALALAARLCR